MQVSESALPSPYDWFGVDFALVSGLDPSVGYCLVLKGVTSDVDSSHEFERDGSPMTPNTHRTESRNGGATWWNPNETRDMRFYIYGTVTTEGEPQWP